MFIATHNTTSAGLVTIRSADNAMTPNRFGPGATRRSGSRLRRTCRRGRAPCGASTSGCAGRRLAYTRRCGGWCVWPPLTPWTAAGARSPATCWRPPPSQRAAARSPLRTVLGGLRRRRSRPLPRRRTRRRTVRCSSRNSNSNSNSGSWDSGGGQGTGMWDLVNVDQCNRPLGTTTRVATQRMLFAA